VELKKERKKGEARNIYHLSGSPLQINQGGGAMEEIQNLSKSKVLGRMAYFIYLSLWWW